MNTDMIAAQKIKKLTHAQQIRAMREALDILKEKFMEAEGSWAILDFMGAAENKEHWMHKIVLAERISAPFMLKSDKA